MSNISYLAIKTIIFYEIKDFLREYQHSIISPIISTVLFVFIFSTLDRFYTFNTGDNGYINFLIPGIIMFVVMQTSYNHISEIIINMKQIGSFNDYLGLVAMIAVFLAGIGAAYLFRNYLIHRFREMSILMSLGATRQQTYQMVLWKLFFLGLGASLVAIFIAMGILPILPYLLEKLLPPGFETNPSLSSMFFSILLGCVGSLVFCCAEIMQ